MQKECTAIGALDAYHRRASSLFIDVRTPPEFEESHIEGAVLHPLSALNGDRIKELASGKDCCILVCRSGSRARQAAEKLQSAEIPTLSVLTGGLSAWEGAGLPLTKGEKSISLERQVRIAAGSLVVIGLLLGYLISPLWLGLSAFVGAGLIFSGVTDTCGMALLLARMPWNK
jgi:rhodanese-related sulfurtransferase